MEVGNRRSRGRELARARWKAVSSFVRGQGPYQPVTASRNRAHYQPFRRWAPPRIRANRNYQMAAYRRWYRRRRHRARYLHRTGGLRGLRR